MHSIQVGLFGLGVVGSTVFETLHNKRAFIRQRLGVDLVITRVVIADIHKPRSVSLEGVRVSSSIDTILDDPEIQIVVELIGGIHPAREIVLGAMRTGKAVVSANKALLAELGAEIFSYAQKHGLPLGMEAAVAGGVPVLRALRESLTGDRILRLYGIVNGTCNFILDQMSAQGVSFSEALVAAQQAGYAEADPSFDVQGHDAAHKLAILLGLAHGAMPNWTHIHREGIQQITAMDIHYARSLGYAVKLLAIGGQVSASDAPSTSTSNDPNSHPDGPTPPRFAPKVPAPYAGAKTSSIAPYSATLDSANNVLDPTLDPNVSDPVEARVHPALVPLEHPLAAVGGVYNAVFVHGDLVGETLFYGRGAGGAPTASAVIGDMVATGRALFAGGGLAVPPLGVHTQTDRVLQIAPMETLYTAYYLRLPVRDEVGVLSSITQVMSEHGISIRSVLQPAKARHPEEAAQIILTTHSTREGAMQDSLRAIREMPFVLDEPQCIRIVSLPSGDA